MAGRNRVRPSAEDIYDNVKQDAAEELRRPAAALAFSGLFAGATVGFGGLAAVGAGTMVGGDHADLIGALFYPIGFVAVIVGRAQLFTENTLYPVVLALDERAHVRATLRLWGIVLAANLVGAVLFSWMATKSGAVPDRVVHALTDLGHRHASGGFGPHFWSGVMAGWILALVAWLIEATDDVAGQVALVWALTFVIALIGFDHCVSTTSQVVASVIDGGVSATRLASWLTAVILGNVAGGVGIVALVNFGQVRAGES